MTVRAFTAIDLLATLAVVAVVVALLTPALAANNNRALRVQCAVNLKQVALAFHIWEGDNDGLAPQSCAGNSQYPLLAIPGGAWPTPADAPPAQTNCPDTYLVYAAMSNELATPKVVVCPADDRQARTNFGSDFGSLKISTGAHNFGVSYFAGRDAVLASPRMLLAGDRDICADTTAAVIPNNGYGISSDGFFPPGAIVGFPTNMSGLTGTNHVGWSPVRMHQGFGNVALLDGSVQQFTSAGLVNAFLHSGDTSTRSGPRNVLLFP